MLPNFILIHGSCTAKKDGLIDVLDGHGDGVILVSDPPYTDTTDTRSTKRKPHARDLSRRISYGALRPAVRRTIAAATAIVEWSAIWDRPEGMGEWRRAIVAAGGIWCGVGTVLQTRGAPRFQGDAPGVRTLCLAIARRKGKVRWRGRPWAEYMEHRSNTDRPIVGTRSIDTAREVIADLAASCSSKCGLVVDPCAGSGMILQAARVEGYRALGFELDAATHAYAQRLLEGAGPDLTEQGQAPLW